MFFYCLIVSVRVIISLIGCEFVPIGFQLSFLRKAMCRTRKSSGKFRILTNSATEGGQTRSIGDSPNPVIPFSVSSETISCSRNL